MSLSSFGKVTVAGIAQVVPSYQKCIDDEVDNFGGNLKQIARIKKSIGLDKRRIVMPGVTAADLCCKAAIELFNGMNFNPSNIDGLIMVTQTPDHFQPSNAAILHGRLGLSQNCASFDVNLGCSGYVYGLWLAHMMINSGGCDNVLLLAGDTLSQSVNPRDRAVAPLFGDAGSATLVSRDEDKNSKSYFSLHTDGSGCDSIIIPAGAFRKPKSESTSIESEDEDGNIRSENDLYMNGAEVFNFSIKVEPNAIKEILDYSGFSIDNIDYIVFHQANKYVISNIARKLKLPMEKAPCETVSKYGNQSSASIPGTITDALSNFVSNSKKRLILSGFGVGLSWASCVLELNKIWCPSPINYEIEE